MNRNLKTVKIKSIKMENRKKTEASSSSEPFKQKRSNIPKGCRKLSSSMTMKVTKVILVMDEKITSKSVHKNTIELSNH